MYRVWNFVSSYSLLLIAGALLALVWANIHAESYHHFVDFVLIDNFWIGHPHEEGGHVTRTLTLHFLVNDVLMALCRLEAQTGQRLADREDAPRHLPVWRPPV